MCTYRKNQYQIGYINNYVFFNFFGDGYKITKQGRYKCQYKKYDDRCEKTSLSIHHYLAIMIHHISCFYMYYEFSVL